MNYDKTMDDINFFCIALLTLLDKNKEFEETYHIFTKYVTQNMLLLI